VVIQAPPNIVGIGLATVAPPCVALLIISSYKSNENKIKDYINLIDLNKLLMISGVLIYFGYFVFGLSDVFFTFAIGHNFYLFSLVFILSAMQWIKRQIR